MSNNDSARDSVLAATLAALGKSAPKPGSPRYGHLQIQIAVLLEDGKDDNPRFLSGQVRDALICAIAADRRQADDFVDIVLNGHHGLAYASDEHVIEAALELTYEDILAAGLESPVSGVGALSVNILEGLSSRGPHPLRPSQQAAARWRDCCRGRRRCYLGANAIARVHRPQAQLYKPKSGDDGRRHGAHRSR